MSKKRNDIPNGMPSYSDLINPTIKVLQSLGGSGTTDEIYNEVVKLLKLPNKIVEFQHSDKSSSTEIQYRLAWARTYLKNYGVLENSSRGVWVIRPQFKDIQSVDINDVISKVRTLNSNSDVELPERCGPESNLDLPEEMKPWKSKLHNILLEMDPYAFERLTQRLLREMGFTEVEVTKRSRDGGIDGFGKLVINGIVSFKVAFQCKRYSGVVPVEDIRDFRGSLTMDFEKAIFITTGGFSKPAKDEAMATGKPFQIDLIDGEAFMDKLAEYQIGLKPVTDYDIDESYFMQI